MELNNFSFTNQWLFDFQLAAARLQSLEVMPLSMRRGASSVTTLLNLISSTGKYTTHHKMEDMPWHIMRTLLANGTCKL